jgi:hypothetical protein
MASFAETTSEEQRWELVAFIETLRREMATKTDVKTDAGGK